MEHGHESDGSIIRRIPACSGAMRTIVSLAVCLAFAARAAVAQTPPQTPPAEAQRDVDALARQTQNPVADLTAVPLQFTSTAVAISRSGRCSSSTSSR